MIIMGWSATLRAENSLEAPRRSVHWDGNLHVDRGTRGKGLRESLRSGCTLWYQGVLWPGTVISHPSGSHRLKARNLVLHPLKSCFVDHWNKPPEVLQIVTLDFFPETRFLYYSPGCPETHFILNFLFIVGNWTKWSTSELYPQLYVRFLDWYLIGKENSISSKIFCLNTQNNVLTTRTPFSTCPTPTADRVSGTTGDDLEFLILTPLLFKGWYYRHVLPRFYVISYLLFYCYDKTRRPWLEPEFPESESVPIMIESKVAGTQAWC